MTLLARRVVEVARLARVDHAAARRLDGLRGVAHVDLDRLLLPARLRRELLALDAGRGEVRLGGAVLEGQLDRHADDDLPRLEVEEVAERLPVAADELRGDAGRLRSDRRDVSDERQPQGLPRLVELLQKEGGRARR